MTWQPSYSATDVEIEKQERVFDGYFKVDRVTLSHPRFEGRDQVRVVREVFKRGNAVCLLLYDANRDKVVLVEQFRIGALDLKTPWMLELIAGMIEQGETSEEVAIREAFEEAGVQVANVQLISSFLPSGGGCDERIDLMYADVDSSTANGVHGLEEEGEDIKVHVLDSDIAFDLVRQGVVNSSPAIIGLQWLELNRDRLRA